MRKFTAISIVLLSTASAPAAFAEEPEAADDAAPADEAAPAEEAAPAAEAPAEAAEGGKASPQAEQGPISVAGLLGYGFEDGYNLGLGVRGGYTIDHGIYVGGTFIYHLGKSQGGTSVNVVLIGAEGGYSFDAGPVIVRPYAGLGLGIVNAEATTPFGTFDASSNEFFFAPGATVLYPLGSAFVGADARFTVISNNNAFGLFLTGGTTF